MCYNKSAFSWALGIPGVQPHTGWDTLPGDAERDCLCVLDCDLRESLGIFDVMLSQVAFVRLDCLVECGRFQGVPLSLPLGQVDKKEISFWGLVEETVCALALKIMPVPKIIPGDERRRGCTVARPVNNLGVISRWSHSIPFLPGIPAVGLAWSMPGGLARAVPDYSAALAAE